MDLTTSLGVVIDIPSMHCGRRLEIFCMTMNSFINFDAFR